MAEGGGDRKIEKNKKQVEKKTDLVEGILENIDKKEEQVEKETEEVFQCFVENRLAIDRQRNEIDPATPGLSPKVDKKSVSWEISKKLQHIADKLDKRIEEKNLIKDVVEMVKIENSDGAFSEFKDIAGRVLKNGISWRNITMLFYFGYCIARDRLTHGVSTFLQELIKWILDIFKQFGIIRWIIKQGGWSNVLSWTANSFDDYWYVVVPAAVVIVSICATAMFLFRRRT